MHLLEPRARPSKVMRWTAPLIAIFATLVVGSLLFWALGKPVAESFLNSFMNDKYLEIEASQLNALFSQIAVAPTMIYSQSPNKNLIKQII